VRVELFEAEVVAGRGSRKTTWLVAQNDGWIPVDRHPRATIESLTSGPGTVWERRIEVPLAPGTRLVRIESEPLPEPPRDALSHLTRGRRAPSRKSRKTELVVGPRGELVAGKSRGAATSRKR
jgi:hypothetical protein